MSQKEYFPGIPGSTATGWVPPEDGFTKSELVEWLGQLQGKMEATWWNLGDMMIAGEITMGDEIYQAYLVHYQPKTIERVIKVCRAYPIGKRQAPAVSIWKHELLVTNRISDYKKDEILGEAAETDEGGLTFKEMTAKIEEAEQEEFGKPETVTGGPFDTAPECPECGCPSQHWQRTPTKFLQDPKAPRRSGRHLKAV